jgi:hypothetical protein
LKLAALILLLLLAALAAFGIRDHHLFTQPIWLPAGWSRFLWFAAVFWPIALALPPRWLAPSAALFMLGYSIWWSGFLAPVAALYLVGSAAVLGRRIAPESDLPTAICAGVSVFAVVFWIALHFPINRPWVYAAAVAIPWLTLPFSNRASADGENRGVRFLQCSNRREAAALALLLFMLMAHWLVALMPEVSDDGLAMHLALPMKVAHDARWDFDFKHQAWAMMPSGGDAIFTSAYLLGGEAGARLVNLGMLLVLAALIVSTLRQWVSPAAAFLSAALFASTPLVQLVTGSLFVENLWAPLVVAAVLILIGSLDTGDCSKFPLAGLLLGAALSMKLTASVFLLPAAVIAFVAWWRNRSVQPLALTIALVVLFGAPVYVFSWLKTGNPVFPFANTIFKSPYYNSTIPFRDSRYTTPLRWTTPYDLTFSTERYNEGYPGGAGLQYFVLAIPALLVLKRRAPRAAGLAALFAILMLAGLLSYLRYMYPAFALLSIAIAGVAEAWPVGGVLILVAATLVNLWILPSAGFYHREFALFRKQDLARYVQQVAPMRLLIADLNRMAPGEPVAMFTGDEIAGLNAKAYTDSWHNEAYWTRVRESRTPGDIAAYLRELGIRYMTAPSSYDARFAVVRTFLKQYAEPTGIDAGAVGIYRLRENPLIPPKMFEPLPPGSWDDTDERIEFLGSWLNDRQFPESWDHSLTYSADAGNSFRFRFRGRGVIWYYTKASNRGTALVRIDGADVARVNQYSPVTVWRSQSTFQNLSAGEHSFEVRLRENGKAVDVDRIVVIE